MPSERVQRLADFVAALEAPESELDDLAQRLWRVMNDDPTGDFLASCTREAVYKWRKIAAEAVRWAAE